MTLKILTLILRGKCCEIKLDYCICSGQCCKDFRLLVYLQLHSSKYSLTSCLNRLCGKTVCTTKTGIQYQGMFAGKYDKVQDHAAVSYIQLTIRYTGAAKLGTRPNLLECILYPNHKCYSTQQLPLPIHLFYIASTRDDSGAADSTWSDPLLQDKAVSKSTATYLSVSCRGGIPHSKGMATVMCRLSCNPLHT